MNDLTFERMIKVMEDLLAVTKTHNENLNTILQVQKQIAEQQGRIVLLLEGMQGEQLH